MQRQGRARFRTSFEDQLNQPQVFAPYCVGQQRYPVSPSSVGIPWILIQSSYDFVLHAEHGCGADLQRGALLEKKLGDISVADLGGGLDGCFGIVLVPSI